MQITYQMEIYEKVGHIIKAVEYIEYNLLDRMGHNTFENMTLGEITAMARRHNILHDDFEEQRLQDILNKRNDLIHQYFKRKDFEANAHNVPFLQHELNYLQSFYQEVSDFNNWLCSSAGKKNVESI